MRIRPETAGDISPVRRVHDLAFGQEAEGSIVDRLRLSCPQRLSLVAESQHEVVGHILFTPATIEGDHGTLEGMALAPMAVTPGEQRKGIGGALVRAGCEELQRRGCRFVIVLGHPAYYPRFGFERASLHGVRCQWEDVPDEAFMILLLDRRLAGTIRGRAFYRPEFS